MSPQLKNFNLYLIVIADLVLFAGAYYGAFLLRFDFALRPVQHAEILAHLPFVIGFNALVFYVLGAYQGMWRYTGPADVLNLAKATFIASLGLVTFGFLLHRMTGQSRAVYVFDGVLTLVLIVGMRVLIRMAYQEGLTADKKRPFLRSRRRSTAKPVLIIGAGDAGKRFIGNC